MYKIYINDTPLFLVNENHEKANQKPDEENLIARYIGKSKILLNYIDMMEKSNRYNSITLYFNDLEKLFEDFLSIYKVLDAGGGVVYNEDKKVLMIFRRGSWDLPKGKIDPGETKEQAALREVEEETGVSDLTLGEFLTTSYHTYRNRKNKRVLKRTYWFRMHTSQNLLVPQTEEDIEIAEWKELSSFFEGKKKVYSNISDILKIELKHLK